MFSRQALRVVMRAVLVSFLFIFSVALGEPSSVESASLSVPDTENAFYERAADTGLLTLIPPSPDVARHLSPPILLAVLALVLVSGFYSAAETAFFSIHRLRLRSLKEDGTASGALIAQMMEHPGRLLTTILISNLIVNMLLGVILGPRVEDLLQETVPGLPKYASYVLAVLLCASVILSFGEIAPKVFAVQASEQIARLSVFPLLATDRVLAPLRNALLGITNLLFKITRFQELRAAPFITDSELRSALTDSEAQGVIEEDERQMIQGILEFSDAQLREILVPRPDIIAISEDATIEDALAQYREHGYSRMPVFRGGLDTIIGTLVAKDLLPYIARGDLKSSVKPLIRPAHYVPATMTVQQFVRDAQRHRTHIAVVVDEYGGTAGIVTLEDAMEQVVGDIMDEGDEHEPAYVKVDNGVYDIDGDLRLEELNGLLGTRLHDAAHETVAGFVMHRSEKVLEPGDELECEGVRFSLITCDGKRVSRLRVQLMSDAESDKVASATENAAP